MFRYGGPIKEGIMSGMKDNRQAINTVGSPLAPKDETYAKMTNVYEEVLSRKAKVYFITEMVIYFM